MSSSRNPQGGEKAQGKREKRTKKRRKSHQAHQQEPRKTETAPHILAALEAQRARTSQQQTPQKQPSQQPRPAAIPGFVFDPERDRFFLTVKNPLGIPSHIGKKATLRVGGPRGNGSNRAPADRNGGRAACSVPAEVSPAARSQMSGGAPSSARPWSFEGRGLHSFVVNRTRGLYSPCALGSHGVFAGCATGGNPGRAAVESIVSSSRFLVRENADWGRSFSAGTVLSSIDWDARRGIVAVGVQDGSIGTSLTPGDVRDEHGGVRASGKVDWWRPWRDRIDEQLSDIKIRAYGERAAFAVTSLGGRGTPGGVNAFFTQHDVQQSMRPDTVSHARVPHGSVWCAEWDPLNPSRLAVGPSSCCPVFFFDVEREILSKIAQLRSDVFSVSFLPPAAPGAGHGIICGLRDGSVMLLDSRENKPPQHQRLSAYSDNASAGGSCGGNDGRGSHMSNHNNARRKGGSCHQQARHCLARMSASVDHTHVLQDGTRCLAKDRSGVLQILDLRFPGRRGPLKMLVPPPAMETFRSQDQAKFALDPGETVVVTPVASTASAGVSKGRDALVGGGERFLSSPRAWDAFANAHTDRRGVDVAPNGCGSTSPAGVGVGWGSDAAGTATAAPAGDDRRGLTGDRLQLLSLASGEVLNDIATPWRRVSLASGVVGPREEGAAVYQGELKFWGKARGSGRGAVVFEARLRSQGDRKRM